jgi:hypothetical protein
VHECGSDGCLTLLVISGELKKTVATALAGVVAQQREVRCVGAARKARLHRIQQAIVPGSCDNITQAG